VQVHDPTTLEPEMFFVDESPARVAATPAARDHLRSLAGRLGRLTVLLTDGRARVLPAGQSAPAGAVRLGDVEEAGAITVAADSTARTPWWRNRAVIDLSDGRDLTFELTELSEQELYAAVASGPLPRC